MAEWKKVKIKDIESEDIQNGYSPLCVDYETKRKTLSLGALTGFSLDVSQQKNISENAVMPIHSLLKRNDILVSRSNTKDKVGRAAVVLDDLKEIYYPDLMMRFQVNEKIADSQFVALCLQSPSGRGYFESHAAGTSTSMVKINKSVLENFSMPLPSIEEQKKIAATLLVWDSAIEKMEKLIEAKDNQKKSLIWKLVENTDAVRKRKIKIDDLFDEVCEKNHPDADVLTIIQGVGTLRREESGRDIIYDKKSLSSYKFVKKGDFIIHLRSFEGGLEVANQDGIVSPAYIILHPKIEVSTDYLYALFHTNRFINHTIAPAVEGARDGRSVKYDALKKQFINLPTFSEQKYIAKIITTAEKEHSLLKHQLENYKKQKQGLMQKLLTGQWRMK